MAVINNPPKQLYTDDFSDIMLWFYGGHLGAKRNAIFGYDSAEYAKAPNKPLSKNGSLLLLNAINEEFAKAVEKGRDGTIFEGVAMDQLNDITLGANLQLLFNALNGGGGGGFANSLVDRALKADLTLTKYNAAVLTDLLQSGVHPPTPPAATDTYLFFHTLLYNLIKITELTDDITMVSQMFGFAGAGAGVGNIRQLLMPMLPKLVSKVGIDNLYTQSNIDVLLYKYFYKPPAVVLPAGVVPARVDDRQYFTELSMEYLYFTALSGIYHKRLEQSNKNGRAIKLLFSAFNTEALIFLDKFINLKNQNLTGLENSALVSNYKYLVDNTDYQLNFKRKVVKVGPLGAAGLTIYQTTIPHVAIGTKNPVDNSFIYDTAILQKIYNKAYTNPQPAALDGNTVLNSAWDAILDGMGTARAARAAGVFAPAFDPTRIIFKSDRGAGSTQFTDLYVEPVYDYFNLDFPRVLQYLARAEPIMANTIRLSSSKNPAGTVADINELFNDGPIGVPKKNDENLCTGQYESECQNLLFCIMNNKSDDLMNYLNNVNDKTFWGDMENIILRDTTKLHGLMLKLQIQFNKSTYEVETYDRWLARQKGIWDKYPLFLTMVQEIINITRRVYPNKKGNSANLQSVDYNAAFTRIHELNGAKIVGPGGVGPGGVGFPTGTFKPIVSNDLSQPYLNVILPNLGMSGQPQVYNSSVVDPGTIAIQNNLRNLIIDTVMNTKQRPIYNYPYYPFRPQSMFGMGMSGGVDPPKKQTIEDLVYNSNIKSNDPIFNALLKQSHKEIILGIFNIKRKVEALFAEMKRLNIKYDENEKKNLLEYYDKLIEGETRGTKLLLYMRAYIELSKLFPNSNNDENTQLKFNLGDLNNNTLGTEQEVAAFIKNNMESLYDKYTTNTTGVYGVGIQTQNYLQKLLANLSSTSGNMTTFSPGNYNNVK